VIFPGAGHAPDNAVTWFSDSGVMFGGCMVKGGDDLGFVGDVDRTSWPDAMRRLIALAPKLVVPGHGSRLDPEQLTRTLDLLQRGAPGIA
jgi:metallo-beta-lactamase class B